MTTATITEMLYLPGGVAPRRVRVQVRLIADNDETVDAAGYVTAGNVTVAGSRSARVDPSGVWQLAGVHPNSGSSDDVIASPANTRYEVTVLFPDGTKVGPRYIAVPDSEGPHQVQDILTDSPSDIAASSSPTAPLVAELPTPSAAYRGQFVVLNVGFGDTLFVCLRDSGGTYYWVQLAVGDPPG